MGHTGHTQSFILGWAVPLLIQGGMRKRWEQVFFNTLLSSERNACPPDYYPTLVDVQDKDHSFLCTYYLSTLINHSFSKDFPIWHATRSTHVVQQVQHYPYFTLIILTIPTEILGIPSRFAELISIVNHQTRPVMLPNAWTHFWRTLGRAIFFNFVQMRHILSKRPFLSPLQAKK